MAHDKKYLARVRRHLICSADSRRRLLWQARQMVEDFLQENPGADDQALVAAFGAPRDLAAQMLATLEWKEIAAARRRRRRLAVEAAARVVLAVIGCCVWRAYDPEIIIARGTPLNPTYDVVGYREMIMTGSRRNSPIPLAKSVEDELRELWLWNDEVTSELVEVYSNKPYYIHVSGERRGREIALRYDGFVTTREGETIPYHRAATFRLYVHKGDLEL